MRLCKRSHTLRHRCWSETVVRTRDECSKGIILQIDGTRRTCPGLLFGASPLAGRNVSWSHTVLFAKRGSGHDS
jgi:hypothetical protein